VLPYEGQSRDTFSVIAASTNHSNSAAVVSRHPPGSDIAIWFRAYNPAVSVVDIEDHKIGTKFFAAIVFALFGVLVMVSDHWFKQM